MISVVLLLCGSLDLSTQTVSLSRSYTKGQKTIYAVTSLGVMNGNKVRGTCSIIETVGDPVRTDQDQVSAAGVSPPTAAPMYKVVYRVTDVETAAGDFVQKASSGGKDSIEILCGPKGPQISGFKFPDYGDPNSDATFEKLSNLVTFLPLLQLPQGEIKTGTSYRIDKVAFGGLETSGTASIGEPDGSVTQKHVCVVFKLKAEYVGYGSVNPPSIKVLFDAQSGAMISAAGATTLPSGTDGPLSFKIVVKAG